MRLLKNWLLFKENKILLIFLIVFLLLTIPTFSIYFGEQSSLNSQLVSIIFTLILPIFIASKYLGFITKEDSLLLVMFDKKDLFVSKQVLLSVLSLTVFSMILLLGIIPHFGKIPVPLIVFIQVLLLLVFSIMLPYFTLKINFNYTVSKSNNWWDSQISNINLFPVRGILLREFICLWRENKKSIFRIILNASLMNIVLMLFIVNNEKTDFFIWALLLQNLIFLSFIINYSTSNNIKLIESMPCKGFFILKGEFLFWLILFLTYFTVIVLLYSVLLSQIAFLPIAISVTLFIILLLYVLLIRIAYQEEELSRTLIFLMILIPITIPYFVYKSYRRIKC
ncbi:MAG: hypothetical protein K9J16_07945 [Melioribacteraceae bacterium]|nr:hypothetical protein [Melioribacteraceae bacterium]MCF8393066.1 hypothetical protein [Melioribacteraceae bacterium]MCF8419184.1 hypothetical protein [Melioribacteraceae bacterium]